MVKGKDAGTHSTEIGSAHHCRLLPLIMATHRPRFVLSMILLFLGSGVGRAWATDVAGVRSTVLRIAEGAAGFELRPAASIGIDFTNSLRFTRLSAAQNLMNGAGIAAGDVDGDGRVDLFFCHRDGASALYLNRGKGPFTNITASVGVALTQLTASGAVFADVNGDRYLDLLVSSFGGPHALLLGDGQGHFRDATVESGIASKTGGTSMALADLDGDGDLDLYFCNFGTISPLRDNAELSERMVNGMPTVTGRWAKRVRIVDGRYLELGEPDVLFWNDGRGKFTPADWRTTFQDEAGGPLAEAPPDFGLAVQIRDVDGDGHPDIYVCNDFQTPDRLWLGDGRGRFRAAPRFALRSMSYASMGVDFADIDRDGHLDFLTAEMLNRDPERHLRSLPALEPRIRLPGFGADREEIPRNGLYRNRGGNTWEEIACFAGVAASDWSWTPLFLDVDLDGWEDLLISNGHLHDVNDKDVGMKVKSKRRSNVRGDRALLAEYPPINAPKCVFRNRRDLTFEDVSRSWGFDAARPAHGMVSADLDGDGDLDLVLNCLEGPPLVYFNRGSAPRVSVRLRGRAPNTAAVGAKVTLLGGPITQSQEIVLGGQYLSSSEPLRVFAAGSGPMTIRIRWRNGRQTVVGDVKPNRRYEIDEDLATSVVPAVVESRPPAALFEDLTERLGHRHVEEMADDFAEQPLLPRRLSQLGPGVAVADVDGDGKEDVVVAAGRPGVVEVLLGDGEGKLRPAPDWNLGPLLSDAIGVLVLPAERGPSILLAGLLDFDPPRGSGPAVLARRQATGAVEGWLAGPSPAGGMGPAAPVLAAADADGDGRIDLFMGDADGGAIWTVGAGKPSRARRVETGFARVPGIGAAVWADLDADGFPELITAGEWGRIAITDGRTGKASALRVPAVTGWWRSLAAGDFNGDGRLDLVAGNWGRNSEWAIWGGNRPALLLGDLDGNGTPEWLEARVEASGGWRPWRGRDAVLAAIPEFSQRAPTHAAFAHADLREWVGKRAVAHTVDTLDSFILINRGDRLEPMALPDIAQRSPVAGVVVADFDGDGREDVFLAQNWFAVRPDDVCQDTGRGLLLRGDGQGGFDPMDGAASGIRLYGEQRGAATGDPDGDGRADLFVAQNGTSTAWLRNRGAKPGLRVRVAGPPGNPAGWGGSVRLRWGSKWGPVRGLTGGGGYGSQDSVVLVLATPTPPTGIELRWPGGRVTTADLSGEIREVTVGADGVMMR